MARLADKVALITGGASGIGRATSELFAKEGARVVLTDVQDKLGEETAAAIRKQGGQAQYLHHDVADEDNWVRVIEQVRKDHGRLDVLVNNAGIAIAGPITELSLADWKRQESINLGGVFLGIKHGLPLLRASGGGSIVNVASTTALGGSGNLVSYAATKGGVRTLTKSVALQCAAMKDGVRVNTVLPGIIGTPIYDTFEGPSTQRDDRGNLPFARDPDALAKNFVPLGIKGAPADIAGGILYLASDEAKYVTGIDLVIDGGLVLG
jgi:NAD(P)-dependent dehydrogenase (short-subunit alcohol dehydrogenase family)